MKASKLVRLKLSISVDRIANAACDAIEKRAAAITYRIGRAGVILGNAILPTDEAVELIKQLAKERDSHEAEANKSTRPCASRRVLVKDKVNEVNFVLDKNHTK